MKRLVIAWCRLAALAVCLVPLGNLYAAVPWTGASTPDNAGQDVNIIANATLTNGGGRVTVDTSLGADVTITPVGGNWTVTAGNATVLDLVTTAAARKITIDLSSFNLSFMGSLAAPLLITHSGPGQIVLNIGDGHEIHFSHAATGLHGTFFLVTMRTDRTAPAVLVKRAAAGNNDASMYIDNYSYVGFIGTDTTLATEAATIQFDPTNGLANTGRLRLIIAEQTVNPAPPAPPFVDFATFAIEGVLNDSDTGFPYNLADVDFNTLAGQQAKVIIDNSGAPTSASWAGLLVLNNNDAYPILRANPWLEALPHNAGVQTGCLMGKNGNMQLNDGAYLDYVGGTANLLTVMEGAASYPAALAPYVPVIPLTVLNNFMVNGNLPVLNTLIKQRNSSAFIVDAGDPTSEQYATIYPSITMLGLSKLYFSSRVDGEMVTQNADFTVDPTKQFTGMAGYGSIVFDVEGRCDVSGVSSGTTKTNAINILSLKELNVGGPVVIKGSETNFKVRNFELDEEDVLKQYGKACFMVNGRLNLINMAWQHDDEIHAIYEKNDPLQSEPCYIGGETFYLKQLINYRPTIALYNSALMLNTSAALTGVDILTPSNGTAANSSQVYFYYNGWQIDTIGRSLMLGTNIGSTAEDLGTIISRAAHFNVWQEFAQATAQTIQISCETDSNNAYVTQELYLNPTRVITGQLSTHNVYLAHDTNVSLGIDAEAGTDPISLMPYTLVSTGSLLVNAEYLNFLSQGGDPYNKPETSIETGQGGIFVDNFGSFGVSGTLRLFIDAMVGVGPYGPNSTVVLPANQVYFDNRVGIANSRLDLTALAQRTIVAAGSTYPDFSLDWEFVTKDYANWTPYLVPNVIAAGLLPAPSAANIASLPVVSGTVDQFQIFNSRAGDPANIIVDAGYIRDLEFLLGTKSGENPTGILIVKNNATVGIGKFNTVAENKLNLGIDGVTIMADGSAQIFLTDDIVVNNICHIIAGPNFGVAGAQQLTITSEVPREFRIRAGATLDLSMFDSPNRELVIAGDVRLIFEPNSRLILGKDAVTGTGGILTFTDNAQMLFQRHVQQNRPDGTSLGSTEDIRVRISGKGTIRMLEDSMVDIPREAYASIESGGVTGINQTAIYWVFEDSARMQIGSETDFGGSLQIGNTATVEGGSVAVTFQLNGTGVNFEINSQGFLGLGTGIVNKKSTHPNDWRVANTFNVTGITLAIDEGTFNHNQIYSGDHEFASLLCFGAMSTGFTLSSASAFAQTHILGGGNIALIANTGAYINPTVLTTDGTISAQLSAGILASQAVLLDPSKTAPSFPCTPANAYFYMKANGCQGGATIGTNTEREQICKRAELCRLNLDSVTAGYIITFGAGLTAVSTINRPVIQGVINIDGAYTDPGRGLAVGVIGIRLTPERPETLTSILTPTFIATRV